jgi:hypothetical protein
MVCLLPYENVKEREELLQFAHHHLMTRIA